MTAMKLDKKNNLKQNPFSELLSGVNSKDWYGIIFLGTVYPILQMAEIDIKDYFK